MRLNANELSNGSATTFAINVLGHHRVTAKIFIARSLPPFNVLQFGWCNILTCFRTRIAWRPFLRLLSWEFQGRRASANLVNRLNSKMRRNWNQFRWGFEMPQKPCWRSSLSKSVTFPTRVAFNQFRHCLTKKLWSNIATLAEIWRKIKRSRNSATSSPRTRLWWRFSMNH